MAQPKIEKGFHLAKLQSMVEPLIVRVEKMNGGVSSPVDLPPTDRGTNDGTGWTKEDVLKLESWIEQIHGFGVYEGKVADASNNTMQWVFGKRPPSFQPASQPAHNFGGAVMPMSQQPSVQPFTPNGGNVIWPALPTQQTQSHQSPQLSWAQPQWNGSQWVSPPQAFHGWQQSPQVSSDSAELRAMREQLEASKRAQVEYEAKAERERAEARHAQELAALREELSKTRELINQQSQQRNAAPAEDPRVKALEEQAREARARADRIEDQRRFDATIAAMQSQTQQQIAAVQTQMQSMMQAAQNSQNAMMPVITLMQTAMAQSGDAAKESARAISSSQDKTIAFLQQNQSQADQVLKNVNGAFDTYSTVMSRTFEMMQNAQGGAPSVADKVMEGIQFLGLQGKGVFEKFMASRDRKSQSDLKKAEIDANVEIAKEQIKLQAEAIRHGGAQVVQGAQVQPASVQQTGGAQVAQAETATATATTQAAQVTEKPAEVAHLRPVPSASEKRDALLFRTSDNADGGKVYEQVQRLRLGVRTNKLTPEQAAIAVLQAFAQIKQFGVDIGALKLFEAGEFDELFEALLPFVASSYIEEAAMSLGLLLQKMQQKQQQPEPEDPDDDDGGEEAEQPA